METEQPKQSIIDRAVEVWGSCIEVPIPNGEPYRPSNGSEGDIFMRLWCEQCHHDINGDCSVLLASLIGQAPEWMYWDSRPICTKWQAND